MHERTLVPDITLNVKFKEHDRDNEPDTSRRRKPQADKRVAARAGARSRSIILRAVADGEEVKWLSPKGYLISLLRVSLPAHRAIWFDDKYMLVIDTTSGHKNHHATSY